MTPGGPSRRVRLVIWAWCLLAACLAAVPAGALAPEEARQGWYTLLDTSGRVLLRTGLPMTAGDTFVDHDNKEYAVFDVRGTVAYGRSIESQAATWAEYDWAASDGASPTEAGDQPPGQATVAIYHTHSDESFVPSDGTGSILGHGGIFKVGRALKLALEQEGVRAYQATVSHDPHDAAAYDRSRRTAEELLTKKRPSMLLDVHRDTAPPQAYQGKVQGQTVAEILLVVGRENPNSGANAAFARRVKATLDSNTPGLVRGIYFAEGDYNQDLSPRALLLEVGTYLLRREEAEQGARLFAQGIKPLLGAAGSSGPGAAAESRAAWLTLLWVVLVLAGGLAGYLYISTGSWEEAGRKVVRFFRDDLGSILRRARQRVGHRRGGEGGA